MGKGDESLQNILSNEKIVQQFAKFNDEHTDKVNITDAVEKLSCLFYGDIGEENSLNKLRFDTFCKKGSTSTSAVAPESLPPTSEAAKQHSYRTYYQVQVWRGSESIDPLSWGWKGQKDKMMPIPTEKAPSPLELLRIFRCGCKTGCKNTRYICVKHGLKCTQGVSRCFMYQLSGNQL